MYELVQAGEESYYIDCPAKIGVWVRDKEAVLIDSGNDRDAGKRVLKILAERGWSLRAILNTHSHADHIGGNRFLEEKTGCAVFAHGLEVDFVRHPVLEPALLYGACPPGALRHKFLMAQGSAARDVDDPAFPREIEVVKLSGHSPDMVAYRAPDGVLFLADSLSSAATLDKYGVTYLYDVGAHLEALRAVEELRAPLFVPAHADAARDVSDLARLNRAKVCEVRDFLLSQCAQPATPEAILRAVFDRYGLRMTFEQNALVGSTVRAYLAHLADTGRVEPVFLNNALHWRAAGD